MQNEKKASIKRYEEEIQKNNFRWHKKPLLRKIYNVFYKDIANHIQRDISGKIVEIGAGIGNLKDIIPDCIRTDLFSHKWTDQVENAYELTFADHTVADLILFDVFHHFRYPSLAMKEFSRVLVHKGRLIIFDPFISLFGFFIWGMCHHEPLALFSSIERQFLHKEYRNNNYYAAQGNATRIFYGKRYKDIWQGWNIITKEIYSGISYVASGGYSRPQLYPMSAYPLMRWLDSICDRFPWLFGTRTLVVLEPIFASKSGNKMGSRRDEKVGK